MNNSRSKSSTLLVLKRSLIHAGHIEMSQRWLHGIMWMRILLATLNILGIGPFAIDCFACDIVTWLFENFFGTLFIFKKNKTEWTTFLLYFVDRSFDLGYLQVRKSRYCVISFFGRWKIEPFRTWRSSRAILRPLLQYRDLQQRLCVPRLDHVDEPIWYPLVCLESRAILVHRPER
jgi:hypothetical protein